MDKDAQQKAETTSEPTDGTTRRQQRAHCILSREGDVADYYGEPLEPEDESLEVEP